MSKLGLRDLGELVGNTLLQYQLQDDPINFQHQRSSPVRDITFLGQRTTIDNLLGLGGYQLQSNLSARFGKWEIFTNDTHRVGLYTCNPTRIGHAIDPVPRFIVRALKQTPLEQFVSDLQIMSVKAIEEGFYSERRLNWAFGLGLPMSLIVTLACGYLWLNSFSFLAGNALSIAAASYSSKRIMRHSYPEYGLSLSDLSSSAQEYDFTYHALNKLKLEAFSRHVVPRLEAVYPIQPSQCRAVKSLSEAEVGQVIAIQATPLHNSQRPQHSRFDEKGTIEGEIVGALEGYFTGLLVGTAYGALNARFFGNYQGQGEFESTGADTPIGWYMRDTSGKVFVVSAYSLTERILKALDSIDNDFLHRSEPYASLLEDQLYKFGITNSPIFYQNLAVALELQPEDRQPMQLYGQVVQTGKTPILQLVAFEDSEGDTLSVQPYSVAELGNTLNAAFGELGNPQPILPKPQALLHK
ncbi:MAG: hypothetical protein ABIG95_00860 [Candidatus Woesearchaeota archaeon]